MDQNDLSNELEVTLRHPSFGEFAFRCAPDHLGNVAADMLDEAKQQADLRSKVAAIDAKQVEIEGRKAKVIERIEAAGILADTARITKEEAALADLEAQSADMAKQREALQPK